MRGQRRYMFSKTKRQGKPEQIAMQACMLAHLDQASIAMWPMPLSRLRTLERRAMLGETLSVDL